MREDISPDHSEEELADLIDDPVPTRGYDMIPVVGLGGSAGSIEALQSFFAATDPDEALAYVVVIHLSPDYESSLADLLQRHTPMPVIQVQKVEEIKPAHVYVIPPGKALVAMDGHLRLDELKTERRRHVAVDAFLRTLADTHGAHGAGIVLSGMDGDGAIGIKRVKERGGLTIAQEPSEAKYPSMPNSAIETGMVDWVLPVHQIPARLREYFKLEQALRLPPEEGPPEPGSDAAADENALRDVLAFLRSRTGRDFAPYKRATILRRIARRMQVNEVASLPEYLNVLRTRPGEAAALLQDLLITVTNFFRDAEAFDAVERSIPSLFAGRGPNDTIRVWVVACATGEEAYSMAMLLTEHARTLEAPPLIQVFATDLDDGAVRAAREALYPAAIEADVNEDRLRRFFVKEHNGYRVRRELREMVLFAVHDVLKDSPFSRLDMVTCRNLLIYLSREAQARVFETFNFALLPQGRLFLGSSESVPDGSPLFTVLDKKHRIYQQRSAPRASLPIPIGAGTLARALDAQNAAREGPVLASRAFDQAQQQVMLARPPQGRHASWAELHLRLIEELGPPSILVDGEYDIVHLSPSAGRFLQYGGGEPSRNVLRTVHESLRIELRASLYHAAQSGEPTEVHGVSMPVDGGTVLVSIRVAPAKAAGSDLFLITLEQENTNRTEPAAATEPDPVARRLDRELERLKTNLRDTVEQYEASNEELKASNEELQAMNEELRSATEELETSREELQSINEELTTVNHELKVKVEELGHANSDLHNLMGATAIATVFLDRELRITRYTPPAVQLFNLIASDIGRPLSDLTSQLAYRELDADAASVLQRLVPVEREVGQPDGTWYIARLLPYRTMDERIAGVVLTFVDITARKHAEESRMWLAAVVKATPDAIISFGMDQVIRSWNDGAESVFGYSADEAIGQSLELLAPDARARRTFMARITAGETIEPHDVRWKRKGGDGLVISLAASPIQDAHGRVIAGTAVARDVTAERAEAEALRVSEESMRLVIENTPDYAIVTTGLDRRITVWNIGAQRLLGFTEREAVGRPLDIIFTAEDRASGVAEQEAARALATGRALDERTHQRKDGSRFQASGSLNLMRDEEGKPVGFVKILQDRSELQAARQALANP